jgi:hypothetical protein
MSLVADVMFFNDAYAWTSYFLFAPVVLFPAARGGRRHKKDVERHIKGRIALWNGDQNADMRTRTLERVALWRGGIRIPAARINDPIKRCKSLAAQGRYALACQSLADAESVAPFSQVTYDILLAKHPNGPIIPAFPRVPALQVDLETLKASISSFPSGSGAGPSRLSPDHIKEASVSFIRAVLEPRLCDFANFLAQGRALQAVQPYLIGASLTPLLKKDGGIRPIACGDVFRRLVAKCLMRSVRAKASAFFAPSQFGVVTPFGAEMVIHSWREALADPSLVDMVALKVDLSNAFNNVDRVQMLSLVHAEFPELFSFANFCYSSPSHLFMRGADRSIPSAQGAQQGDPLGPLFSCLVFHEVVKRISLLDVKLNMWYMDDGGIIASPETILQVLDIFVELRDKLGLFLNEAKTEVIWLSGVPPVPNPLEGFAFKVSDVEQVEILGAPIGPREFCDRFVVQRAVAMNMVLVDKLQSLNDPQVAFLLLRSCLSYCKMMYFMRTVPVGFMPDASFRFDELMLDAMSKLIGFKISPDAYSQLVLSISQGGLGLRKVADHHAAAFFSSIRACLPKVQEFGFNGVRSTRLLLDAENALVPNFLADLLPLKSQSAISAAIDKSLFDRLFQSSSSLDQARLLSCSAPHAADFLVCPPIANLGLKFLPAEWSLAVSYKLGVDVLPAPNPCPANGCHAILDKQAGHAIRCGCQGDRVKRHNLVRNFFFKECQRALMEPVLEPNNLVRNAGDRPADWGIPDFKPGVFMAYDVAITDPSQVAMLPLSARDRGAAAEEYAEKKIRKYSDALANDNSLALSPIILESFGAWGKGAVDFISDLSRWLAARDPSSKVSEICCRLFQRVSVLLQRANARMIASRIAR